VPIGGVRGRGEWADAASVRRVDGAILSGTAGIASAARVCKANSNELAAAVLSQPTHLIEVKRALTRGAIGQAIAARRLFERNYKVAAQKISVVCARADGALRWVCEQEGIGVIVIPSLPSAQGQP
jgi:hypothetical protein